MAGHDIAAGAESVLLLRNHTDEIALMLDELGGFAEGIAWVSREESHKGSTVEAFGTMRGGLGACSQERRVREG